MAYILVVAYVLTLCLAVGRASAHGSPVMPLADFKPRIWHQFHWTNRALKNRCRPTVGIRKFTRYPMGEVHPWWRDERVQWAKAKHHRAQRKDDGFNCRRLGRDMAAKRGWTGYLWERLDGRITGESGWNPCRHNPSTTNCGYAGPNACAIPQAYPCSKLLIWCGASTIGGCPARRQIRWALDYITARYGSPANLPPFPASY